MTSVPIISNPSFYLAAIPAVILLGLAKGGFAGVGTAATPLLALYMPPLEGAALLLPILITQDAISVIVYRRQWDAGNLRIMLPGAMFGLALGWLITAHISDDAVRIAVGVIGLVFVLNVWFGRKAAEARRMRPAWGLFWGGVSGFTSFMTQGGAPPFQVYVLPQRLPKLVFVGTSTIFFAVVNLMKVVPYFLLGQFNAANLGTSLMLLPTAITANFLGVWLVRTMPTGLFYHFAYALLFLISLSLLWQGVPGLWRA